MGRVNIEVSEELHKQMKIACAQNSITIIEFIKKALEDKLKKRG
jgi:predicted HicB family RNase H-like nuclease